MSSMIYELAIVQDRGPYWYVTNVTKNVLDNQANTDEKVLKLSYVAYQQIKDAIIAGKAVHIRKSMRIDEVLPGDYTIIESGSKDADILEETKRASLIKVRMLVTPELAKISGFAMYGFIVLNNDLINEGYAITNDNREEKYLEILETGDEKLISKLEDYLNYKDEIESVSQLERKFSTFRNQISIANTVEAVAELEQKFLEAFYRNF
jgi:hypothetical protein